MSDLIRRDELKDALKGWAVVINKPQFYLVEDADHIIDTQPAVDAVEVVRCKDCKHWDGHFCEVHSEWPDEYNTGYLDYTEADDFCSYGERKEGADNG